MARIVLGVTGAMQSGKQELLHVFRARGWVVYDLNVYADEFRSEEGEGRPLYERLNLAGDVNPDGTEKGIFYQRLARNPDLHRQVIGPEVDYVARRVREQLDRIAGNEKVVISWGYVYKMLDLLPLNYTLVFCCGRRVWLERLKRRALDLAGIDFSDQDLLLLAQAIEMMPGPIVREVRAWSGASTTVNTSGDDWGESCLVETLAHLDL